MGLNLNSDDSSAADRGNPQLLQSFGYDDLSNLGSSGLAATQYSQVFEPTNSTSPDLDDVYVDSKIVTDNTGSDDTTTTLGNYKRRVLGGPYSDMPLYEEEFVDSLIHGTSQDGPYWTATDHAGSVRDVLIGKDELFAQHIEYDLFGEIEQVLDDSGGAVALDQLAVDAAFSGRRWDSETELYYNRARWYDPAQGRFISQDPIGHAGGVNLYVYAGNDPVNYGDPSGNVASGHPLSGLSKLGQGVSNTFLGTGATKPVTGPSRAVIDRSSFGSLPSPESSSGIMSTVGSAAEYAGSSAVRMGGFARGVKDVVDDAAGGLFSAIRNPGETFDSGMAALSSARETGAEFLLSPIDTTVDLAGSFGGAIKSTAFDIGTDITQGLDESDPFESGRIFGNVTGRVAEWFVPASKARAVRAAVPANVARNTLREGLGNAPNPGVVGDVAGSIRTVNPNYPARGFNNNCVECVIATERRFAGAVGTTAKSTSGPLPISRITDELGGSFENVSGMMDIGRRLSQSGNGARGIVYGADHARGFGHVWNVRIDKGVVRFLDGQPASRAGLGVGNFDDFTDFKFLLTSPGN